MAIGDTPFVMTLAGLIVFFLAYTAYSRYIDRKVWRPDPSKPTPAHMYTDGVEYFPVSRFVLYGFQWKSIAALGPVLGPGIALTFGWLPALLWILGAALLIGWVQDYSAIFLSVRQEGRSLGPLAYQFLGSRPRQLLLIFLIFYLLLINAAFIFVVATVIDRYSGSFWSFLSLVIAALLSGHLLFRVKMSIVPVTILAIVIQVIGIIAGAFLNPLIKPGALGTAPYTLWLVPVVIILLLGALLPMPRLLTPMNYIAYYSLVPAVVLLVLGALASPITGVTLKQPAFTTFYTPGPPRSSGANMPCPS
jgi:carbon starvation protein